jgi:hypothetical protein
MAGAMIHSVSRPFKIAELAHEMQDVRLLAPMMIACFTAAFEAPATEIHNDK